jgi:two-component system, cell cycle response regulator
MPFGIGVAVCGVASEEREPASGQVAGNPAPEPSSENAPMPLVIADDDSVSRQLLQRTAEQWGFAVTAVGDGASALARLSSRDGPRIGVLDWEMPGMSGPQTCRILRGRKAVPYVYLILLTGLESRDHRMMGLASGADDYVAKPFDPMELRLRLRAGQRIVTLQQELLTARNELERRANHDALTGALNRGAMLTLIETENVRSQREDNPFCIVLLDLDHFKRINDQHGHSAGDAVLKESVTRLADASRPYDALGRYGGEEFMLLLPGCELDEGLRVAERLRHSLVLTPFQLHRFALQVTASFGVVCSSQHYPTLGMMIDAADRALYRAKSSGRDRVEAAQDYEGDSTEGLPAPLSRAPRWGSMSPRTGAPSRLPREGV